MSRSTYLTHDCKEMGHQLLYLSNNSAICLPLLDHYCINVEASYFGSKMEHADSILIDQK